MTDEHRQEMMRRQAEGMRSMSNEAITRMQLEQAPGMMNAWPGGADRARGQGDMSNFWRSAIDATPVAKG